MHHRVGLGALLRSLPCSRVVLFCARGEEAEAKRAEEARHGARRCSGSAPARAAAAAILLASRAARAAETLGLEGPELAAVRTEFDLDPTTSATRRTNTAGGPISSGSGGVVSAPCPSLVEAVSTVVLVTSRLLCAVDSAAISRVVLLSDDAHFCAQLAAALKAQSASQSRSAASLSVDFADFSPHALAGEGGGTLAAAAPGERACVALLRALGCEESADASGTLYVGGGDSIPKSACAWLRRICRHSRLGMALGRRHFGRPAEDDTAEVRRVHCRLHRLPAQRSSPLPPGEGTIGHGGEAQGGGIRPRTRARREVARAQSLLFLFRLSPPRPNAPDQLKP
ncbi:hypothetical protein T492DRAFT_250879 [Pavlovales sp. CCMP2436]|nr:hypothetical protein T492DRAFT_250879 [Pavlovales sp. CCMP2436]